MGGKCCTLDAVEALWRSVREGREHLAAIFLSESDFLQERSELQEPSGFLWHRHWPGPGSRACSWLLERRFAMHARCWWRGRIGVVVWRPPGHSLSQARILVGWHGAHDFDSAWQTLLDLRWVLRACRGCPNVCVAGDANINYLSHGGWPFPEIPFELALPAHSDEDEMLRKCYEEIAEAAGLKVSLAEVVRDVPGGPWSLFAACVPVTRVPQGLLTSSTWPGVLDHAMLPPDGGKVELSWRHAPADHAVLMVTVPWKKPEVRRSPRSWRPVDEDECVEGLRDAALSWPSCSGGAQLLPKLLVDFCEGLRDRTARQARKAGRLPLQARSLLAAAAAAADEEARQRCKKHAWSLIYRQQRSITGRAVKTKIAQGRPLAKKV